MVNNLFDFFRLPDYTCKRWNSFLNKTPLVCSSILSLKNLSHFRRKPSPFWGRRLLPVVFYKKRQETLIKSDYSVWTLNEWILIYWYCRVLIFLIGRSLKYAQKVLVNQENRAIASTTYSNILLSSNSRTQCLVTLYVAYHSFNCV